MERSEHAPGHFAGHPHDRASGGSLDRLALSATTHCLAGCAIGEVLGMTIGTAAAWSDAATVAASVLLAFVFGYSLTLLPLLRARLAPRTALGLALGADTASIALMEVVDNAIMLVIPGAMSAGLRSPVFWGSLAASLVLAGGAAFPLNRWLIRRGRGHALVHRAHARA